MATGEHGFFLLVLRGDVATESAEGKSGAQGNSVMMLEGLGLAALDCDMVEMNSAAPPQSRNTKFS